MKVATGFALSFAPDDMLRLNVMRKGVFVYGVRTASHVPYLLFWLSRSALILMPSLRAMIS